MSAAPAARQVPTAIREYWYEKATNAALLNSKLLQIVPWECDALNQLPRHVYPVALAKIDELVTEAARRQLEHGEKYHQTIWQRLDAELWNFLKAWNRSPDVPPYARPSSTDAKETS